MARSSSKARRKPKAKPQGILELTARGFGFVKTAEGEFFIPPSKIGGAFPGDLVEVSRISSAPLSGKRGIVSDSHRLPSARVVKVLMRSQETLLGRYEIAEPFGVVIPEDCSIPHDIFTLHKDNPGVKDGDLVEVEIIEYPTRKSAATGRVRRVVGHSGDSNLEIDIIIAENKLETEFSDAALLQAQECELDIESALARGYRDLRGEFVCTIDPLDARDFDDAISLQVKDDKYYLSVHIADVSTYVPYNSSLDLEARRRATSVYLVDRVLPMLPENLSNNLCSLNPGQPRLAMTVQAVLNKQGNVESYEVFPSVIVSNARLSYEQAQALIEHHQDQSENRFVAFRACDIPQGSSHYDNATVERLCETVGNLSRLAQTLFSARYRQGCMDFDRVEARVTLDDSGTPVGIKYRCRNEATHAIEEAMILANHLVAEWLINRAMPCVFRVHDEPDGEALYHLYCILQEFSSFSDIDQRLFCDGHPQTLQEVLRRANMLDLQGELVNTLLLRSMKRAHYTPELSLHYGLALETYCHFTSPIRRYPDLLVHRMIKETVFGRTETFEAQKNSLSWLSEHSSKMERIAAKAEYKTQMLKIVEYMLQFVGQTFECVIAGVSTFGLTVRMENTAQGLLPLASLGMEHFSYDPDRYTLTGVDTGIQYRLGQKITVVLTDVDIRVAKLYFKLA